MKTYESGLAPCATRKEPEEIRRETPKIGDRKTFVPASFDLEHSMSVQTIRPDTAVLVTGTVVEVHENHRWCRVRYSLPSGGTAHECFKY